MLAPSLELEGVTKKPLGQRLIELGVINELQLQLALREKKRSDQYLGELLVSMGFVTQVKLTQILADETNTPVIDILHTTIEEQAIIEIPYEKAKEYKVLPIKTDDLHLTIAIADAFDIVAIDAIEKICKKPLILLSASEKDIAEAIELHYAQALSVEDTVEGILAKDKDCSIPQLVSQLLISGITKRATDIHIEPEEKILRVRFRIDGILYQEALIPNPLKDSIIARIKLLASLNVTEKRLPQDGRIQLCFGHSKNDLRVSTMPTQHGESIVLRILSSNESRLKFSGLGFNSIDKSKVEKVIKNPFGLILVTGPTGSGKTTTLYSAIDQIDTTNKSVFTLEDPIEYAIPNIRQTQIDTQTGMTFSNGLRALLRQDPDVILVGEMRDSETAKLAVRAALTGHLVFSTLHTNNAAGVIPRLLDMGVEQYLLPPSLSAIIGQRLVRKLCTHCKTAIEPNEQQRLTIENNSRDGFIPEKIFHGSGCSHCKHTGYQGRLALYEVLILNEEINHVILQNYDINKLNSVINKHMTPLASDGINKVCEGLTSLDEVMRVTL